jgi:hypothetical protein
VGEAAAEAESVGVVCVVAVCVGVVGCVVVGCVVVGVDVFGVGMDDFVGDGDFVGVCDFDGVGFLAGGTTLLLVTPSDELMGCGALGDAFLPAAECDGVTVGATVLLLTVLDGWLLLEISTAMIATTPMAAAPIPANKNARDPLLRGAGILWVPF